MSETHKVPLGSRNVVVAKVERNKNITGQNIRNMRLAAHLTQKQLSEKLKNMMIYVCRGSVSRIESGERIVTDIELEAIAEVLHVSIESLFIKKD